MNGWIGQLRAVLHYLDIVGADRDDTGNFKIDGEQVVSGYGDEVVVPAGTTYTVKGHRCNLAAGLSSTSSGTGIKVF